MAGSSLMTLKVETLLGSIYNFFDIRNNAAHAPLKTPKSHLKISDRYCTYIP
jgi:hypothetical protein